MCMFPLDGGTQWVVGSAAVKREHEPIRTGYMAFAESHRQTPIGSTTDGTRTGPLGTRNMGKSDSTGESLA